MEEVEDDWEIWVSHHQRFERNETASTIWFITPFLRHFLSKEFLQKLLGLWSPTFTCSSYWGRHRLLLQLKVSFGVEQSHDCNSHQHQVLIRVLIDDLIDQTVFICIFTDGLKKPLIKQKLDCDLLCFSLRIELLQASLVQLLTEESNGGRICRGAISECATVSCITII